MYSPEEIDHNLKFLHGMLSCNKTMYHWTYNIHLDILETNCPHFVLNTIFDHTGCREYLLEHANNSHLPLLLSAELGIMWGAAFEFQNELLARIHVIGPVFTTEISEKVISDSLRQFEIPFSWKRPLISLLCDLPVITSTSLFQDILMLHYAVTGEPLQNSDIQLQKPIDSAKNQYSIQNPQKSRQQVWQAETSLMQMIRDGNLNYKSVFDQVSTISCGVQITVKHPMQQIQITYIIFISLCVRAAIEGGLSPEISYPLGDSYIQSILACRTVSDAMVIGHSMYEDFIQRVHKCKSNPKISREIQSCCDYIQMNIEEDFSLKTLAQKFGYTDYYFSRRFKKETGKSFNEYVKNCKVSHGKTLLVTTSLSIQEISERLHFCSRTHFTDTFRKLEGISPTQYREEKKRI